MTREANPPLVPASLGDYFQSAERPLTSLLFLLPLVLAYEIGTAHYASDYLNHTEERIVAFTMMRQFFAIFGARQHYLPACAVIAVLLACHVVRKDPWKVRPGSVLGMYLESALLGVPPLLMGQLLARIVTCQATGHMLSAAPLELSWKGDFVLAIGAGIYEELVFRLILFSVLSLVLVDLLRMEKFRAGLLIVVLSAVLFSAYHYLGRETFTWRPFIFRILAGVYFSAIYLVRGFGVSAGTHAAYDVISSTVNRMLRGI